MEDLYGAPTSSNDARSLQICQQTLADPNCYRGDSVASIDKPLAQDWNFAMGQVFHAHARRPEARQRAGQIKAGVAPSPLIKVTITGYRRWPGRCSH